MNKGPKIIKTILPIFVILAMIFTVVIPAMAKVDPVWDKSSLEFKGQGQTTTGTGTVTVTKEVYGTAPDEASDGYEIAITGPLNLTFTLTDDESKTRELPAGNYTVSESSSYGAAVSYSPSNSFTVSGSTAQIYATVKNNGSAMDGTSDWELYYSASGNPKGGTTLTSGEIPPLGRGESYTITYNPTVKGNYIFKAYQRPGHPGAGALWSKAIAVKNVGSDTQQIKVKNTYIPTPNPDISISKSGPDFANPNDTIIYNFTVTNTGNVALADITVTDQIFGSGWNYNIGNLDAGDSVTFSENYTIPADADETITNTAVVTGYYNQNQVNDEDSFDVAIITQVEDNPVLTIDKTGPNFAYPNDTITYNFTVTNTGNVTLTDIVVTDPILGSEWSHDVGTLNPGSSTFFTADYVIPGTASGTITNTATVTGNYGDNPVTDNDNHNVVIIIEEEEDPGSVKIIKTIGSQNGTPQTGVTFTLLNGTTVVKTETTDANGELIFEGLEAGSYNLTEQVPSGYTTNLDQPYTVTVTAGETTTVKVVNSVTTGGGGGGGGTTPGGGGGGTIVIPPEEPTVPPEEPTTPPEEPGEVIVPPEEPTTKPEVILPPEEPKAQPEEEKLPYTGADANVLLGLLMGVILAGSGLFFLKKSRVK